MITEKEVSLFEKAQDILTFSFSGNVVHNPSDYFLLANFAFEVNQIYSIRNSDYNISHYLWGICHANLEEIVSNLERRNEKRRRL